MIIEILAGVALCVVALAMIVFVLLQKPKDDGGSTLSANSNMKQLLGVAQMPSFLEKATYYLLLTLCALTLLFNYLLMKYHNEL